MSLTYISDQLLTTNLFVPAKNVNKNIDDVIKDSLKEQLEGLCYEDGYVVKGSVSIVRKSMGKIVVNDNCVTKINKIASKITYNSFKINNIRQPAYLDLIC